LPCTDPPKAQRAEVRRDVPAADQQRVAVPAIDGARQAGGPDAEQPAARVARHVADELEVVAGQHHRTVAPNSRSSTSPFSVCDQV
jgi:hypothetical protein